MTEVQKYIEVLKEIASFSKNLDKDIVISIINQFGIDSRLKRDSTTKSTEAIKEPVKQEFIPATDGQVRRLKVINKFVEGLSKSEAWAIINADSKKEQEY